MAARSEWVARGRGAIVRLLADHLTAPVVELEARISDKGWRDLPPIDPHLLTHARRGLAADGLITPLTERTRGGSDVTLWALSPIPTGKKRATEDVAARKRLLMARWHSWSRASRPDNMPNLIGQGGEAVVHNALLAAAATGYRLVQPVKGEVATLFAEPVPGGSLDNAAWLSPMDAYTQAPTGHTYLIPIEVKNLRTWLYPTHWEVHQLLYKAARLQVAHPKHLIMPILICRRAHTRLRWLAADLGFLVFETYAQYVHPNERVSETHFAEVRDELGLADLEQTNAANPKLVTWLSRTPQREVKTYSARWTLIASSLADLFDALRQQDTPQQDRIRLLQRVHKHVLDVAGKAYSWATNPDEDHDSFPPDWPA